MQRGAGRDPGLYKCKGQRWPPKQKSFLLNLASSGAEYKDVRNIGGRPGKRRQLTELKQSRKERERTKDSQGKIRGREFPGPIEFCNWVFIINHKSYYVLSAKQSSHTWSHLILTTTLEVCMIICRTVLGVAGGKIQTARGWEVTEWGECSLPLG